MDERSYTFSDAVTGLDLKAMLGVERTGHAVAFRRDTSALRSPATRKDKDDGQER
ncbi:hypothetical protein [Mesorhizobium sp. B2-8-9]|uniref:hypothetical protein n=1 Tax=Mesorhizobium sp. B2-8-9 TaxID=2589899 RepID=UPI0015E3EEC3|nr:hypothetical protein [Mesorhizobium sp. B2-8-9]